MPAIPAPRTVILPHLDGEFVEMTAPIPALFGQLLTTIVADRSATPSTPDGSLIAISSIEPMRKALLRIRTTIGTAEPHALHRPDGLEHEPLLLLELDGHDIVAAGEALVELRRIVLETSYRTGVDEHLTEYLAGHYPGTELDTSAVLELLARFHGVLDLDHGHDQDLIEPALRRAQHSLSPVTLDDQQEAALDRMGSRWLAMWLDRYNDLP